MGESSRDVLVWQRAIALAVCIHELTRDFPREEMYGLAAQIRRTSIAVASNIAEGGARADATELRYYLGLAKGSAFELKTQLLVAGQLGMGNSKALSFATSLCEDVTKGLAASMKKMSSTAPPLPAGATALNNASEMVMAQA